MKCVNCGGEHTSNDIGCQSLIKHKIINAVMAYANISRYNAIRMIKLRNISSLDQVANCCKSLPYRGWDIRDIDSVSVKSQAPSNYIGTRNREILNTRNKNLIRKNTKAPNLPLVSSSRYLSCVEYNITNTTNTTNKLI